MTDQLDEQIKSAMRRQTDNVEQIVPDLGSIGQRAASVRRRRAAARASMATAAVVLVAGASITGAVYLNGDDTQQNVPTATDSPSELTSPPSSDVTPSSTPTQPDTLDEQLLAQLAESSQVRQYLLGVPDPTGLVLCGMNKVGTGGGTEGATSTETLYIWLECGTYTTGDQAALQSGGADPAVVVVTTDGHDLKLETVEFPPFGYQPDDIRAMFPPEVADKMIQGHLPVTPSQEERLQTASASK